MRKISLRVIEPATLIASPDRALNKGNEKLGKTIGTFSIPAIATCALGSTETCRSLCYADNGFFLTPDVQKAYALNLTLTHRPDFVEVMTAKIRKVNLTAFRWHVAGDLYSPEYAGKVLAVMEAVPETKMFIYTRTWRTPRMVPIIARMAALSNVQLWLSCDRDTGEPVDVPRARRAYMQVAGDPGPTYPVDLVFRDKPVRDASVAKRVSGAMVCPVENGTETDITCTKCRICFTDPAVDPTRRTKGRFAEAA